MPGLPERLLGMLRGMSSEQPDPEVVIVDPDTSSSEREEKPDTSHDPSSLVEEPAKVIRIGRMVHSLLEEVKAAPLDEAGRTRLAALLHTSVKELKEGLAPELDEELDRLVAPFDSATPTESELRIAQATLTGWLEGLFHGIQSAMYAQQMAARAQLEQIRALPPGIAEQIQQAAQQAQPAEGADQSEADGHGPSGMYL